MKKAASILGYFLMIAGLLGLLAMRALFSPHPAVIGAQVAAVLLMFWARITFGRRSFHLAANPLGGGLVTWGPYGYIRHPIYASVCLFCFAGIAAHLSWRAVALGVVVATGTIIRIFCEESLLPLQYPDYLEYSKRTWRLVPFIF